MKRSQSKLDNLNAEMKIELKAIRNSKLNNTEERMNDLEDRIMEITE